MNPGHDAAPDRCVCYLWTNPSVTVARMLPVVLVHLDKPPSLGGVEQGPSAPKNLDAQDVWRKARTLAADIGNDELALAQTGSALAGMPHVDAEKEVVASSAWAQTHRRRQNQAWSAAGVLEDRQVPVLAGFRRRQVASLHILRAQTQAGEACQL